MPAQEIYFQLREFHQIARRTQQRNPQSFFEISLVSQVSLEKLCSTHFAEVEQLLSLLEKLTDVALESNSTQPTMKESSSALKVGKCPKCQRNSLQYEGEATEFLWCPNCDVVIPIDKE